MSSLKHRDFQTIDMNCKLLVRTMPRASHRGTGKRRVNQVNEDSKLKSEVYRGAKAICTEGRGALGPIGP